MADDPAPFSMKINFQFTHSFPLDTANIHRLVVHVNERGLDSPPVAVIGLCHGVVGGENFNVDRNFSRDFGSGLRRRIFRLCHTL